MSTYPGLQAIVTERIRQVLDEHWSAEHDDAHTEYELVWLAIHYACPDDYGVRRYYGEALGLPVLGQCFPEDWDTKYDKRDTTTYERRLEIAGALIAAELDRVKRL